MEEKSKDNLEKILEKELVSIIKDARKKILKEINSAIREKDIYGMTSLSAGLELASIYYHMKSHIDKFGIARVWVEQVNLLYLAGRELRSSLKTVEAIGDILCKQEK